MATVELEIPSRSVYVAVVRLALASLARDAGLDEERVDDLRIAVSEACADALPVHLAEADTSQVCVRWTEHPDRLEIEVEGRSSLLQGDGEGVRPRRDLDDSAEDHASLSAALLRSLVDECTVVERSEGGTRTRLTIRR